MTEITSRLSIALADRYRIQRRLGEGGMATVYLAGDLKHDRKVAIKVLRPDLAAALGPDRFLREVRIAASLAHPHILGLHDSGEADGFLFYVMPYIDGESLRDRLNREGELPIPDAIRLIREIVDALGYAHAHNVVHRDIKPDNVMLTGRHAMVADFGVAKAVSEASGRQAITTAGVALGTPAYMAPEQAAADAVDHRADVYAVGILAYEILTGQPPFTGTTAQQVLAAHMREKPRAPSALREAVPPLLDEFVRRCLEKRAADRYQTADEMLRELDLMATPSGGVTPTATAPIRVERPARRPARVGVAMAVVLALGGLGFLGFTLFGDRGISITVSNVRAITRGPERELGPALSPIGQEIAYIGVDSSGRHLYVQDLTGGRSIKLTDEGRDAAGTTIFRIAPTWTPGGRNVVVTEQTARGRVAGHVIPRFGGVPEVLVSSGTLWDVTESKLLIVRGDSLLVVDRDTGAESMVSAGRGLFEVHSATFSPDGRRVLFVVGNVLFLWGALPGNVSPAAIWMADVESGETAPLIDDGKMNLSPRWLPGGREMLFVSDRDGPRDVYALSLNRNRPVGDPVRVTTGLDAGSLSLSRDGTTALYTKLAVRANIWSFAPGPTVATSADLRQVIRSNEIIENHDVSADGQWIAFDSDRGGNHDIYLQPLDGGGARRLTDDPAADFHPDFSPDGSEIVFYSMRHGTRDLFVIRQDGTGLIRLTDSPGREMHAVFSPSGLQIAYGGGSGPDSIFLISRATLDSPWGEPKALVPSAVFTGPVAWSPDGNEIAFRAGSFQLEVTDLQGQTRTVVDAAAAGLGYAGGPVWSEDGTTIYFDTAVDGRGAIYAVPSTGGTARPVLLMGDPRYTLDQWLTLHDGVLYLTLKEVDADIWVMELQH